MLIDLHTHTHPLSDDSVLTPDELLAEAKEAGLHGVCLTEHDRFWDADAAAKLSQRHGLLVLPGCEVTTEEGHLLVFGLKEYVFGMHRAAFVKRLVDGAGGAVVVAHPYRRTAMDAAGMEQAWRSPLYQSAHAVEVENGRGTHAQRAFARDLSSMLTLPATGASDAHRRDDVGAFATEFARRVSSLQDLIGELRAGRFKPARPTRLAPTEVPTPAASGKPWEAINS
jgi:predicted metal-dependent phosphoesterase TrpH